MEKTEFKKHLMKYFTVFIASILFLIISGGLFLFAQFIGEIKELKFIGQGIQFQNTITVSGKGEVKTEPDVAQFSFAVIKEDKTSSEAQKLVTEKMNAVLITLGELGIVKKDLQTTNYNIVPRYEYQSKKESSRFPIPDGKRVLIGYEVSHWITVKIRNVDQAGEILAEVGGMNVENISGLSFIVDDEEKIKREARRKAVANAKEKAQAIADDFGVRLVKVVSFNERGGVFRDFAVLEAVSSKGGVFPIPEIPSGESTITSHVTVVYAVD